MVVSANVSDKRLQSLPPLPSANLMHAVDAPRALDAHRRHVFDDEITRVVGEREVPEVPYVVVA